jgi:PAS domain S-box-containing protein
MEPTIIDGTVCTVKSPIELHKEDCIGGLPGDSLIIENQSEGMTMPDFQFIGLDPAEVSGVTATDRPKPLAKRFAAGSAAFIVGLGVTVLVGWFFHYPALVQFLPQLPPVTRNAGVCFLLCGLALLMVVLKRSRWLVIVCTGIVSIVSVLTIVEYVFHVNVGIDELLGPSYITVKLSSPGRMAPVAAICFTMASIGLLLAPKILSRRATLLLGLNGSIIAAVGMATSMGIALGSSDAFGWGNVTRVSLQTAVGLSVLGFGILALVWHVETYPVGTPRWLPMSVAIAVGTSTLGLWQALIAGGHAPFALLPAVVLGGGCLMAPIFGLTVYLAQRAQAQAAGLRARERDLSLIIETIPGLVWCASPDGELTYVNQRILDYTGASLSELAQAGWVNFLHPDDVRETVTMWTNAVRTGNPHDVQYRLRRYDGVYRWFHVLGQAMLDAAGRVSHWYGLLIDIEDRKSVEEALRRTETRLSRATQIATVGELAASIAHEINQPLGAVVTNAYACLRWLSGESANLDKAREAAERIVRDGKATGEVVARIRALFKQTQVQHVILDLNAIISEVVRLIAAESGRRRVAIETHLQRNLTSVLGDRVQIQQLILNLLMNGLDAMDSVTDRPKKIVIRSQQDNPTTALVEIEDNGVSVADCERVFEPFFTTKEHGMGMGLTICRSIAEAHNGKLWATPNKTFGTTFRFTLPLHTNELTEVQRS